VERGTLRSLPTHLTSEPRVLVQMDEALLNEAVSASLASLALEKALPVRRFVSWQGKRNYEGVWWSSTTRRHIPFESLLERQYLMAADFDGEVLGIASQPLALLWPHRTVRQTSHVPDFFCRLNNGDGRLVDVRRPDKVSSNAEQFELTRKVCEQVGWQYEIFTGLPPGRLQNLRWLSGYRQDRSAPDEATATCILDTFARGTSLGAGIIRASTASGASAAVVQANVLHLLFAGTLQVDLDCPLSMEAEVSV
jgi:hypothetical protein